MYYFVNINPKSEGEKIYDNFRRMMPSEVFAVSQMTKICEIVSEDLENIKDEQTEYEIDFLSDYADLLAEERKLEDEIIALNNEIKALEEKEANGTITEEERAELAAKRGELSSLVSSSKRDEINQLLNNSEERSSELQEKLDDAQSIGEVTLEHGEELANTEVKKANWFRKLFGITKKQEQKKAVGEKAVEVSTDLLEQVKTFDTKDLDVPTAPTISTTQSTPGTSETPAQSGEQEDLKEPEDAEE